MRLAIGLILLFVMGLRQFYVHPFPSVKFSMNSIAIDEIDQNEETNFDDLKLKGFFPTKTAKRNPKLPIYQIDKNLFNLKFNHHILSLMNSRLTYQVYLDQSTRPPNALN